MSYSNKNVLVTGRRLLVAIAVQPFFSSVETYFALLKRTAKTNKVEFVRVSNGKKRTQNATDLLMKALYNINAGVKIKKRTSCNRCEFRRTEHCP